MSRSWIFLLALCAPMFAHAAKVTTRLNADETVVGSPVRFEVRVEGGGDVVVPGAIDVDGLETVQTGRSVQTQWSPGSGMTSSKIYQYLLLPTKEGDFEVSAEVIVDGKRETTPAQSLHVGKGTLPRPRPAPAMPYGGIQSPAQQQPQQQTPQSSDDGKDEPLAYAEVILSKTSVYAGELVPAEIRFYFNDKYNFQLAQEPPQVSGEGFTVAHLADGRRAQQAKDGVSYNVITFKTALTAVKSGRMELPKASMRAIAQVPSDTPSGMDDIFERLLGGHAPGIYESREIEVTSDPATIEVKPLPAGKPANFSGAIGDFTIAATAEPGKAAPGDPVTLKAAVSGQGNFDVMTAPTLVQKDGWREYPATDSFESADPVGFDGTKTFSFPLIAQTAQTQTPVAKFSYFDPTKGKYFTIETQPVKVEAAPSGTAADEATAESSATPTATPTPESASKWIAATKTRTFHPLVAKPAFWIVNAIALVVLVGWLVAVGVRRAAAGPAAQRRALAGRRDDIIRSLDHASDAEFYEKATAAMTLQAELTGTGSAHEWARANQSAWSDETREGIDDVLGRADALKYGAAAATAIDPERRGRVIASLKEVCK